MNIYIYIYIVRNKCDDQRVFLLHSNINMADDLLLMRMIDVECINKWGFFPV